LKKIETDSTDDISYQLEKACDLNSPRVQFGGSGIGQAKIKEEDENQNTVYKQQCISKLSKLIKDKKMVDKTLDTTLLVLIAPQGRVLQVTIYKSSGATDDERQIRKLVYDTNFGPWTADVKKWQNKYDLARIILPLSEVYMTNYKTRKQVVNTEPSTQRIETAN
jgi:hypothetical protein